MSPPVGEVGEMGEEREDTEVYVSNIRELLESEAKQAWDLILKDHLRIGVWDLKNIPKRT